LGPWSFSRALALRLERPPSSEPNLARSSSAGRLQYASGTICEPGSERGLGLSKLCPNCTDLPSRLVRRGSSHSDSKPMTEQVLMFSGSYRSESHAFMLDSGMTAKRTRRQRRAHPSSAMQTSSPVHIQRSNRGGIGAAGCIKELIRSWHAGGSCVRSQRLVCRRSLR